ncbi:MAG: AAA family ATPase [Bacilli bacterium]
MLERKITKILLDWKNNTIIKKKALVIKGLRQIGKTFIVKQFAKDNYENQIYINFKNNDDLKSVFEENLNVDRILIDLSAKMPNIKLIPYKTIIIFDEIQECANARASIKAFVEDGRYDIIATGSLLGIKGYNKKKGKGVPTGSEHIIYMYPLDFEEFLWAKGISKDVINYLKECFNNKEQISKAVHESMIRYFKEYICVGGLPEAVNIFLKTGDMNQVYNEQRDILEEYKDDFGKHLDANENEEVDKFLLARIEEVFDSIPSQLAKENKKFQYSKIKIKGRSADYREAIQWLIDAGIVIPCYNLSTLESPLEGNKIDNVFKLYIRDSGLFVSMLEKGTAGEILSGNLGVYKGAIYENIIADAFAKMDRKLYYFHKDSGLEIDFITKYEGNITLIEVKSTTGKTKSASTILNDKNYNINHCIKFGEYNIGFTNNILTLPYYLVFLFNEI